MTDLHKVEAVKTMIEEQTEPYFAALTSITSSALTGEESVQLEDWDPPVGECVEETCYIGLPDNRLFPSWNS